MLPGSVALFRRPMPLTRLTLVICLFAVCLLAVGCGDAPPSSSPTPTAVPQPEKAKGLRTRTPK
jgi:hypothetical protein